MFKRTRDSKKKAIARGGGSDAQNVDREKDVVMAEVPNPAPKPKSRKEKSRPPPSNYGIKFRNSKHQKNFETLYENRRLVQTRFACEKSLTELGLLDQVKGFCEQLGIWKYVSTPVPGYYKLTYEFLASFEINRADDYQKFSCQIAGTRREITAQQINEACGFPNRLLLLLHNVNLENILVI